MILLQDLKESHYTLKNLAARLFQYDYQSQAYRFKPYENVCVSRDSQNYLSI